MKLIRAVLTGIDRVNAIIAKAAAWLMLPLVLIIVYEVVLRYAFHRPTLWVFDMTYFFASIIVMFGAAYTLQSKGHVSVDIFYERLSPRTKALIDVVLYPLLFFTLWLLTLNVLFPHVINSILRAERAVLGVWLPPIWPFKSWLLLGIIMLTLQGVAEWVRAFCAVIGRPLEPPAGAVVASDPKEIRL